MKLILSILATTLVLSLNILSTKNKFSISAKVVNVSSDEGKIGFALFDKNNFMGKPILSFNSEISNGESEVTFTNISPGEYAIVCYHDKNNNGKMDFTINGMPLEDYGSSNNVMNFGPPTFENAKFTVFNKNVSLDIKF